MSQERHRRLEDLFESALRVDAAERQEFVVRACADDDELRARLEELLAAHTSDTRDLVLDPDRARDARAATGASGLADDMPELPEIGQRIGDYTIVREIGRGGMGTVFLARDRKFGRDVALKFMFSRDAALNQRFRLEARTTAQCTHENIVVIHDIGEYATYYSYLVLEYVRGSTLRALLRDQAGEGLKPTRALEIMTPVVKALGRAHDLGIVHRDLKPENIMISDSGHIKVMDFGIAKNLRGDLFTTVAREHLEPRVSQTLTGLAVGTLPYMAPEQWGMAPVDHRSDIWAVGVILYEMLAGRHPIMPSGIERLYEVVANPEASMPRAAGIAPDIGALAQVIDRCLQKDKADRFASASELLDAFDDVRRDAQRGPSPVGPAPDDDLEARAPKLEFARITVAGEDEPWRLLHGRPDDSPFATRCAISLRLDDDARDAALPLDVTLINLYQRPILVTEIGLQLVSVSFDLSGTGRALHDLSDPTPRIPTTTKVMSADHYAFDGVALLAALVPHRKRVFGQFRTSLANARSHPDPGQLERVLAREGRQTVEVGEWYWHGLADPVYLQAGAPYRYGLRVDDFQAFMPARTLVRLGARSQLGAAYSGHIELAMPSNS